MTKTTPRLTIIVFSLLAALMVPVFRNAEAAGPAAPSFSSATDEDAYNWTNGLLAAAELMYPTVAIEFHRSLEPCGGMRGRTHFDDGLATVHVCAIHANRAVEDAWRRRTLLHEIAHAWIDQNVAEASTHELMAHRGVEKWASRDQVWADRGIEHAAEILMWGLLDGDYRLDFRIDNTACDELTTGYELLTGIVTDCG